MNVSIQRILFAAWNADNEAVRQAYYEHLNEIEAPEYCSKGGHEMTDENSIWDRRGWRSCRRCKNDNRAKDKSRTRAA